MKLNYHPETDSLYIDPAEQPSAEARETAPGVLLDLGADGRLVGIDLDHASRVVDLATLEAGSLPLKDAA
jgi:uncharacterized protein YuzE